MRRSSGWLGAIMLLGLVCYVGVARAAGGAPIQAVGVENQYADVIGQIGGRYVRVVALLANPNTDPHTIEVSPKMAQMIARAGLIVENGLGYDGWAAKMIAATPRSGRVVIIAGRVVALPGDRDNPHIWYDPRTMPAVARAIGAALSRLAPGHAAYFAARVQKFDQSLDPWRAAIAAFKAHHAGVAVAVTEPVGDFLLTAMGAKIETPPALQAAMMNGTDPSPQDVATENGLLRRHGVRVLVYNRQVTDPLTAAFLRRAERQKIPVVGVYETMPQPGYSYQSWMLAETQAIERAVSTRQSTLALPGRPTP